MRIKSLIILGTIVFITFIITLIQNKTTASIIMGTNMLYIIYLISFKPRLPY